MARDCTSLVIIHGFLVDRTLIESINKDCSALIISLGSQNKSLQSTAKPSYFRHDLYVFTKPHDWMHRESHPRAKRSRYLNTKAESRKCGVEAQANPEIRRRHQGFRGPEPVYRAGAPGLLVYGTLPYIVGRHG
jgi:hypothetical protein